MAKVMCFYCKEKKEKSEMYQVKIGAILRNYCDESCYIKNREPIEYRSKLIAVLYSILNIKFQDGGTIINKKIKELESYPVKTIFEVVNDNQFELQMMIPSNGTLYGKVSYVFSIIKSKLYELENPVTVVEEKQVEVETEFIEEYIPMKPNNRKNKIKIIEELKIDF